MKEERLAKELYDNIEDANSLYPILSLLFEAYKNEKAKNKMNLEDSKTPNLLIEAYYKLQRDKVDFDEMCHDFIEHYTQNESELEQVHPKEEIEGLKEVYKFIHTVDMVELFEENKKSNYFVKLYTPFALKKIHEKLYTYAPHSEYAGAYRNDNVYLPGSGTDVFDWSYIKDAINEIDPEVQQLLRESIYISSSERVEDILAYLDKCIEIKCQLIKIHPFSDGNGRTIRAFINILLEKVSLPPIYISASERDEYGKAMQLAVNEDDYSLIKAFYRFKICDSIVELGINPKIKQTDNKKPKNIL